MGWGYFGWHGTTTQAARLVTERYSREERTASPPKPHISELDDLLYRQASDTTKINGLSFPNH
ncbi:hypothetical protein T265_06009 [Opisthorchis viverrini]|uniref:Uncharacterized protein n=1 Tax=Opisthorchis viverrini TaxID=6198 RepID=A0A074ZII4_OPIVI|nr:hypothetical protein T265_06009 [Opisthorchis viverrini]KER26796.1 hypothetical protein T265_06009 [Opisthorchis viverrini]